MKIQNIKIFFIKKKYYNTHYPTPYFYKEGFVFIKLICENGLIGYGEPSPYIKKPSQLILIIEKIFKNFFKNKTIDLNYVYKLKNQNKENNFLFKAILPAFESAIFDIFAKAKKKSVSEILNEKNLRYLNFYASGGMISENQNYDLLIDEALKFKSNGYLGYKFRPKLPIVYLNHFDRIKNPPKINIKELESFSSRLRNKIGDKFKIMIDLGCRINTEKEASYLFKMFNEHNYYFVEEPFKRDFLTYKKLIKYKNSVKIAGGEHINSIIEFKNWRKKNYFDFYQPDTNLLLYKEMNIISKLVGPNKIILHNWCNKINFSSNANFAFSQNKKILLEKNIIPNPFDDIFTMKKNKIKNGKLTYKKDIGLGISIQIPKNKKYIIYEKKI